MDLIAEDGTQDGVLAVGTQVYEQLRVRPSHQPFRCITRRIGLASHSMLTSTCRLPLSVLHAIVLGALGDPLCSAPHPYYACVSGKLPRMQKLISKAGSGTVRLGLRHKGTLDGMPPTGWNNMDILPSSIRQSPKSKDGSGHRAAGSGTRANAILHDRLQQA